MTDWTGMGKVEPKRRGGANLGQEGPSAAKIAAQLSRDTRDACDALRCAACPYTDARCAWACRLTYAARVEHSGR